MKRSVGRPLTVLILIFIIFLVGMLMNYFMLGKVIVREQYGRVKGDVNFYVDKFLSVWDENPSLDSLYSALVPNDPYGGTFCVMTPSGEYLFDSDSRQSGIPFRVRFGEKAAELLEGQLADPYEKGWMGLDPGIKKMFYVRYDLKYGVVFFYQLDLTRVERRYLAALYKILAYFIIGIILIVFGSLWLVNSISRRVKREADAARDLETAAHIQQAMLPRKHRHLMNVDIDAKLIPAQGVGGDLYYYLLNKGKLFFCIGDVSGKGVPASLSMSRAVTLFRSLAQSDLSASEITSRMNSEMCINNDHNIFITAIIGVLHVVDGRTSYCNAGHGRPLYWNGQPSSRPVFLEGQGGLPLGFDPESQYEEYNIDLEDNSLFMLCTDGVNEARRKKEEFYGFGRLVECVDAVKSLSADKINEAVISSIHSFVEGTRQSDDITMLTFRNIRRPKILEITNRVKDLRGLSVFIAEVLKECPLDGREKAMVRAGLDEAMTNCVQHAYGEGEGSIVLKAWIEDSNLVFELKDSGKAFNPLEYEVEASDEVRIGGMGIHIMKASFEKMEYSRTDNENILTLKKRF